MNSASEIVADVYGQAYIDKLTEDQKNQSAAEIIHYLCSERYGLDDANESPEYILKMINMRYAMGLNSFQQFMTTTIAFDVSDETAAAIMENQSSLTGVDIEEDSPAQICGRRIFRFCDRLYRTDFTGRIRQSERRG